MSQMETEINAAEEAWGKAMVAGDIDVIRRLVAEDVLIFHGSGEVEERRRLSPICSGAFEVQSLTRTDVRIRQIAPDVGVASCVQVQRIRPRANADAPFDLAHANISKVWVRRGGQWQMPPIRPRGSRREIAHSPSHERGPAARRSRRVAGAVVIDQSMDGLFVGRWRQGVD